MRLSVIIPTIAGREESLERCMRAYTETAPHAELVVVLGAASWPEACNAGARQATGDVLHFTADDIEPLPGWWEAVATPLETLDELPAPRVLNHSADGHHDNASDGPDGAFCHFTRVPILTRSQYDRIGPWPEFNYVADVWLSAKARTLGIPTRLYYGYAFVHHWDQHGRVDSPAEMAVADAKLSELLAAL